MALYTSSSFLATSGARTVLDLAIAEKIGDKGTFKEKAQELVAKEWITEEELEIVEAVIEAGNASIHRAFELKDVDLGHLMDILEALLDKVYAANKRLKQLRERGRIEEEGTTAQEDMRRRD